MLANLQITEGWKSVCAAEFQQPYFQDLRSFLEIERSTASVFPPENEVFAALERTPLEDVRVLILGQDPYHDVGQANGLCFSVKAHTKFPPSLKNIFRELNEDVGVDIPSHGCLTSWARQGVLLLNTVLTVRAHEANSHRKQGWERFTDQIIRAVNQKSSSVVFVLWGKPAQTKKILIDQGRHTVIEAPHPSPLSASRGFFGSRPFSKINETLATAGQPAIAWNLPSVDWDSQPEPAANQ